MVLMLSSGQVFEDPARVKMDMIVSIAKDFHPAPGGRYLEDGPNSAQRFRDDVLLPKLRDAIENNSTLIVRFDGMFAVSSSFLEEAFGGLLRLKVIPLEKIRSHLRLEAGSPAYEWARIDAEKYIEEQVSRH
jgi:STAS-like domain of unknown function (DUF4325)